MDETSSHCSYVCPDHNYLESWCDLEPVSGQYSMQQPIIRPLYNTRQSQESFMVWSGNAVRSNSESQAFYDYIRNFWIENSIGDQSSYLTFDEFWNWTVHNGHSNSSADVSVGNSSLEYTHVEGSNNVEISSDSNFEFVIYQKELGTGNHAANPWLQELPDAISKIVWDNYITMAPSDCYELFNINSTDPKSAWDGIHLGQEEKLLLLY